MDDRLAELADLDDRLLAALRDALADSGNDPVRAAFRPDLDANLTYAPAAVVLTDHRIFGLGFGTTDPGEVGEAWSSWPLDDSLDLAVRDQTGLGSLELTSPDGLIARWRFTIARTKSARGFAHSFADVLRGAPAPGQNGEPATATAAEGRSEDAPPQAVHTSSALSRLLRFGRPRLGAIVLGFTLTLLSTAAGLIPPYLTQPLIDDVLVPKQSGLDVPFSLVTWYLVGMAVASVLAWILGWARSYVMAWVGERISADLRDQTYGHLLRMSMEYFGGKRTGDLMSRISSDTDRICQFLSVSLVDFATDILMIIGTAIILVWKAPLLAAATLLPMPLVGWLVHRVRYQLRHGFGESYRAWAEITSVLADTIPGIRVVKAFAQEGREEARFATANAHNVRVNDRVNAIWAFFGPMLGLLTQLGLLLVWVVGAYLVFHGGFKVGLLTMFLTYLARFYLRLESMSRR